MFERNVIEIGQTYLIDVTGKTRKKEEQEGRRKRE
jgi:hypothetical protein